MKKDKLGALLAGAGKVAQCKAKRLAWARHAAERWLAAQTAMDERCTEAVGRLSEEEFERLCEEEEAKIERFRGPLIEARDQDKWPWELYSGGI